MKLWVEIGVKDKPKFVQHTYMKVESNQNFKETKNHKAICWLQPSYPAHQGSIEVALWE